MTAAFYDVFISHAYEDKNEFSSRLALQLKKKGLKIWYFGLELKLGDSIAASVNYALKNASFGIVFISPVYFELQWAMNELEELFSEEERLGRIFPVLHGVSAEMISARLPVLTGRLFVSTGKGMQNVVRRVLQAVTDKKIRGGK